MSGDNRNPKHIVESNFNVPNYKLDFYQAVRKLESDNLNYPSVGNSACPEEDIVRFAQRVSVSFATSNVSEIERDLCYRMTVNFFGLLGTNGPMPLHITEKILAMTRNKDDSLKSFLDIFNNRITALFYKAWKLSRPAVLYGQKDESFSRYISSIAGIGSNSLADRDSISDNYKRYYAVSLSNPVKNSQGLKSFVSQYFGFNVILKEFTGQWLNIADGEKCFLGDASDSCKLGCASIIGRRVWNCQSSFELAIGPVDFNSYNLFLPGGKYYVNALDLIKNYCRNEYVVNLRIILKRNEVKGAVLGHSHRLGYSSWLNIKSGFKTDADNLIFRKVV